MGGGLIPAKPSRGFSRFFARYCRRMMRRDFAGVRLARGSAEVLRSIDAHGGPAIALINHASWWDPLIGLVLADTFAPSRVLASPIEAEQLKKFAFMRRLGIFGIDPESPEAKDVFVSHCLELFASEPRTLLGLTPQGSFADVREPIRLRPGAAAVAGRLGEGGGDVLVVSIACELVFWFDRKPELLMRAERCAAPERATTAGWTRAMTRAMQANQDALAALSVARETGAFEPMLDRASRVHPVFDLWMRLRGKGSGIDPARRGPGGPGGEMREREASA